MPKDGWKEKVQINNLRSLYPITWAYATKALGLS